jgi:hypothetical protein
MQRLMDVVRPLSSIGPRFQTNETLPRIANLVVDVLHLLFEMWDVVRVEAIDEEGQHHEDERIGAIGPI